MARRFAELTFTDSVRAAQDRYGAREHNERYAASSAANVELGSRESAFIAARDSFYMATVGDTGWPYVQHRGGRPGFLKVLDARTLVFADFRGNRQYQSVGNLDNDDRVCLILVDYAQRRRLKLLGHARIVEREVGGDAGGEAPEALADLFRGGEDGEGGGSAVERVLRIAVVAYDWNCSRHIPPRFSADEMARALAPLQQHIDRLETRLRQCGCEPAWGAGESNMDAPDRKPGNQVP